MKKVIFSLALFASVLIYSQKNTKINFVVVDDVIGTESIFKEYKSNFKSSKKFQKNALPANLQKYAFLADNGLTQIVFKPETGVPADTFPIADFNEQNKLPANNPIIVEGYEIPGDMKIFSNIIKDIVVKDYNGKKTIFVTVNE